MGRGVSWEGAGCALEAAPVEELPCGSHSGAWAAAAPQAELSPRSGQVCSLLPALCSQAMDTLVNAPSLLPVGLLFSRSKFQLVTESLR